MSIIGIAGVCIVSVILCKLMEKYNREYAVFITLAITVVFLLSAIVYITPIIDTINSLFIKTDLDSEYIEILFKSLGICYITQFAYDICKDNGEGAIATQIELAGKISLLLLSLPLFKGILDIAGSLIG